jgi:hypothetical protein
MDRTDPEASRGSRPGRRIVSEDLPLVMFTAVLTWLVLSALDAVRELVVVGVVLAPLIADLLKHWIATRGWSRRRLLGLTGLLTLGGTAREVARGRGRSPATAVRVTASVAAMATVVAVTAAEVLRGEALLVDRPTTSTTARSPEAAIAAFAARKRWTKRGWEYEGDCGDLTGPPRRVVCSARWNVPAARPQLAPGEHAYLIAHGWSDVELLALALERSRGRWRVSRVLHPAGDRPPCTGLWATYTCRPRPGETSP